MDGATLFDWYISSVVDGTPVWTEEHIDELLRDFLVIPINTPAIKKPMVKHGHWIKCRDRDKKRCSECDVIVMIAQYPHGEANYCPNCGADMREEAHNVD
jgi:predicted RNA-binding Zn-ribbon protein involved in translation (DUF1610 family)